jgi:hypothetical protein
VLEKAEVQKLDALCPTQKSANLTKVGPFSSPKKSQLHFSSARNVVKKSQCHFPKQTNLGKSGQIWTNLDTFCSTKNRLKSRRIAVLKSWEKRKNESTRAHNHSTTSPPHHVIPQPLSTPRHQPSTSGTTGTTAITTGFIFLENKSKKLILRTIFKQPQSTDFREISALNPPFNQRDLHSLLCNGCINPLQRHS